MGRLRTTVNISDVQNKIHIFEIIYLSIHFYINLKPLKTVFSCHRVVSTVSTLRRGKTLPQLIIIIILLLIDNILSTK